MVGIQRSERHVSEGKKPVFGGCFNMIDPRYLDMFASVSGNRKDESFYTVAWMRGQQGRPLLAASGSSGVIRIIDCWRETVVHSFTGTGGAVNEVSVHPTHPSLLLSASKDESERKLGKSCSSFFLFHTYSSTYSFSRVSLAPEGAVNEIERASEPPRPAALSWKERSFIGHGGAVNESFIGHGGAVNEVRVHPFHPAAALRRKDESLRLIMRGSDRLRNSNSLYTPSFPPEFHRSWGSSERGTAGAVNEFIGHGGAVNEVRVHPTHPALLLSAGKDESLRLWNTDTGVCVAIMGGSDGHRNEVLSAEEWLRLWNTDTGVCVAIMSRADGHRNEVLSAVQ
ncbi:unnamed protein product [Closterium sp. NIES-64]|nr:unnamed protein product [Closterium sp. NIES-64]